MKRFGLLLSLALLTGVATNVVDAQSRTAGFPPGTIIDLSYSFESSSVYWPTAETFRLEKDFEGTTEQGYYYSAYRYWAAEHGGTHIDAPVHFAKGRYSADQILLPLVSDPLRAGCAVFTDFNEVPVADARLFNSCARYWRIL